MKTLFTFLLSLLISLSAISAQPPITIVVAYPPGGDTDVLARLFAEKLSVKLSRPVIVENRPGASGAIGTIHVSKSSPTGDILLLAPSTLVTLPLVNPQGAKYNPVTDLTPIMQLSGYGMFAVINSNTGIKTIPELIAANKAGKVVAYGSPGAGSPMHILGELFNKIAGTDIQHIPYKGNNQVISNMLGDQLSFTWITLLPVIPHVNAGKMNIIGIAGHTRSPFYPNVPTLEEQGIHNIDVISWLGFLGPKGMNKETVKEINTHLREIALLPEIQSKFKQLAMTSVPSSPEAFEKTLIRETAKFEKILKIVEVRIE